MGLQSNITIAIMVVLRTMLFDKHVNKAANNSPFAGSTPISKMELQKCAIQDLSESARKQLLHARQRWPAAVHTALWPYALRNAALLHNALPMLEDGSSWLELFSSIQVGAKMANNHAFACPVFALQNKLAAGNLIPKWSPRARLGLNLGPSPMHARDVYLSAEELAPCQERWPTPCHSANSMEMLKCTTWRRNQ
jgi:hypothetical protein